MDTNNDGALEIVILLEGQPVDVVEILHHDGDNMVSAEIEATEIWGLIRDVSLVDIDFDGGNEVMVVAKGATSGGSLAFLKYRNGRYERLGDLFYEAYVSDFDGDGRTEVVEQPWNRIPDELWPAGQDRELYDWGRVRMIWRWDPKAGKFEHARPPELLYIGGR